MVMPVLPVGRQQSKKEVMLNIRDKKNHLQKGVGLEDELEDS